MSDLTVLQNCATVQLTKGQNTLIDAKNSEMTSSVKWQAVWQEANQSYYAVGEPGGCRQYLHRATVATRDGEIKSGMQVDHKNRDTLDNREDNLRVATSGQNRCNAKKKSWRGGMSSKYKGVNFHKAQQKWRATISVGRKQTHLGTFASEIDAARAYNVAATRMFGEFARINEDV
jgi:HNH endonuclease/AP2 domain